MKRKPLTTEIQTNAMTGSWVIAYYSPSLAHNMLGSFSAKSGHVGCQDVKVPNPPKEQPNPKATSTDAVQIAVARILQDSPGAKLPGLTNAVNYGKVSAGANPPHDAAWMVSVDTFIVIVDDASFSAVECLNSGTACN